jgi:hypothetical protein
LGLTNFYSSVELANAETDPTSNVGKYYKAALQATNDRGNRIARGSVIEIILADLAVQRDMNLA